MFHKPGTLIFCTLFTLVFLTACAAAPEPPTQLPLPTNTTAPPTATPNPPTSTPIPPTATLEPTATTSALLVKPGLIEGMVDVGGRSLYIHCEGEGSPTIILVTGELELSSKIWEISNLFRKLAATTLTCAYDSPGYGKSDPATQPRTAQDATDDLHMLLTNGQIPGPYILVSQAYGSWPAILYAAQFPEETVGMVLMEPYHPDIGYRWSAAFPTASPDDSTYVINLRKVVTEWYNEDYVAISSEQVRAVTSLGDLPLFVITDAKGYTLFIPEVNQAMNEPWWAANEELAALSTNSKWIKIEDSSYIMWEQKPDEVIRAIREMVELTRK